MSMSKAEQMAAATTRIEGELTELVRPVISKYVYNYEFDLESLHIEDILWTLAGWQIVVILTLLCLVWHRKRIAGYFRMLSEETLYPFLLTVCTEISFLSYRLRGRMPSSKKEQERLRMRIRRMLEENGI